MQGERRYRTSNDASKILLPSSPEITRHELVYARCRGEAYGTGLDSFRERIKNVDGAVQAPIFLSHLVLRFFFTKLKAVIYHRSPSSWPPRMQLKKPLFLHERAAFVDFLKVRESSTRKGFSCCFRLPHVDFSNGQALLPRHVICGTFRWLRANATISSVAQALDIPPHTITFFWDLRQVLRRYDALHGLPPCLVHCFTGSEEVRHHDCHDSRPLLDDWDTFIVRYLVARGPRQYVVSRLKH